jgi:dTDP-glucose 4,6-dehydratase
LYVEDHVRALDLLIRHGRSGQLYCIGANGESTNSALVLRICRCLDQLYPDQAGPYERLITQVADRPGHDFRYGLDATLMRQEIGWKPLESLESGLIKTIRWYLDNLAWVNQVRAE